ncbi:MAG: M16 family metallopeptidase [Alphaproteobacteria bacterium]
MRVLLRLLVLAAPALMAFAVGFAAPAGAVAIERVVSAKGVEAWLVRDTTVPVVAAQFAFHGGSALDPEGKEGLANLVAGLLDEGAGDLDSQTFQRRLEDLSISLGFDSSIDSFGGSLRTLKRNEAAAFDLLRLALNQPRFDAAAVDKIKDQTRAWLSGAAENPRRIAGRLLARAAFGDHPYGRPSEGTRASIDRIAREDLQAFAKQRFARDRLVVAVVGDITAAELRPRLDAVFGDLPASAGPVQVPVVTPALAGQVYVVEKKIPQSVVTFGQAGLSRQDPDYYIAHVMNHAFGGGGFASRLMQEIRDKRGLAYGVNTGLAPYDFSALYTGGVATQNERVGESIDIIRKEWARLRDDGLTERELADAKTFLTGSFLTNIDSTGRMASLLVGVQLENLGIDYLDKRNGFIEAVTVADVKRVAARLLDPAKLTFVVVGEPRGVTATAQAPALED